MAKKKKLSEEAEARFYINRRNSFGELWFDICDHLHPSGANQVPIWNFDDRVRAVAFLNELNRDPKKVPGAKVRIIADKEFGASRKDELHRIYGEARYGAGDEGVLTHPHPNQLPDGCEGWWYMEVAPKEPVEPRFEGDKETEVLYVGCWPGSFEVIS